VARLAGLPAHVTDAADRILADLLTEAPLSRIGRAEKPSESPPLFGTEDHPILKALRRMDIDRTTPLEALEKLAEWRRQLS
jgi:DNA mismatch repair protein MutS